MKLLLRQVKGSYFERIIKSTVGSWKVGITHGTLTQDTGVQIAYDTIVFSLPLLFCLHTANSHYLRLVLGSVISLLSLERIFSTFGTNVPFDSKRSKSHDTVTSETYFWS